MTFRAPIGFVRHFAKFKSNYKIVSRNSIKRFTTPLKVNATVLPLMMLKKDNNEVTEKEPQLNLFNKLQNFFTKDPPKEESSFDTYFDKFFDSIMRPLYKTSFLVFGYISTCNEYVCFAIYWPFVLISLFINWLREKQGKPELSMTDNFFVLLNYWLGLLCLFTFLLIKLLSKFF